jgi:hypothetical protein
MPFDFRVLRERALTAEAKTAGNQNKVCKILREHG